jgi:hypothetical protein
MHSTAPVTLTFTMGRKIILRTTYACVGFFWTPLSSYLLLLSVAMCGRDPSFAHLFFIFPSSQWT